MLEQVLNKLDQVRSKGIKEFALGGLQADT